MNKDQMKPFIDSHRWQEATTYAAFLPHEYTVRGWLESAIDTKKFNEVVLFIRAYGFTAMFGRKEANQYFIVDEHYYWTMPDVDGIADVLNRARLDDYIFWEDLLGDLHCRRRKRNEPVQPREEVLEFAMRHGQVLGRDET